MQKPKIFSYFDAAVMISFVTAFMYFVGYLYYAAYYRYFGVELAFFPRAGADYIITAWEYAFWFILTLIALGLAKAFLFDLVSADWIDKTKAGLPRFVPSLFALVGLAILLGAAQRMEHRGARDAKDDADKKKIVRIFTTTNLDLPKEIYFLSYSQGKYLLYYFPTPFARPNVIVVNDSSVTKVEFPPTSPTEAKKG